MTVGPLASNAFRSSRSSASALRNVAAAGGWQGTRRAPVHLRTRPGHFRIPDYLTRIPIAPEQPMRFIRWSGALVVAAVTLTTASLVVNGPLAIERGNDAP